MEYVHQPENLFPYDGEKTACIHFPHLAEWTEWVKKDIRLSGYYQIVILTTFLRAIELGYAHFLVTPAQGISADLLDVMLSYQSPDIQPEIRIDCLIPSRKEYDCLRGRDERLFEKANRIICLDMTDSPKTRQKAEKAMVTFASLLIVYHDPHLEQSSDHIYRLAEKQHKKIWNLHSLMSMDGFSKIGVRDLLDYWE